MSEVEKAGCSSTKLALIVLHLMDLILAKCSQTLIFIYCCSDHFTIKLFLSDVHLFMAKSLQKAA